MNARATYLLAGGGRRRGARRNGPDPLLAAVFGECGKPAPAIAYVGAATGDNPDFFQRMAGYLLEAGASDVRLAPMADRRQAARALEAADMVFMGGGDVERGITLLEANRLIPLLRRLHGAGVVFFGSSAGSIMLARQWIRWRDPDDDASAELFPCLGLAATLCDTHGEGEDWEELVALMRLAPAGEVGYGIPSGAALRVTPDGVVSALGDAAHRFARREDGRVTRLPDLPPDGPVRVS